MAALKFVLVMTVSPRRSFGRAGLRFTDAWRPLRLAGEGEAESLEADPPVISNETYGRIERETMLAVKPATEAEIVDIMAQQAAGPKSAEDELVELRKQNAALEARLMKLELAAGGDKSKAKDASAKP